MAVRAFVVSGPSQTQIRSLLMKAFRLHSVCDSLLLTRSCTRSQVFLCVFGCPLLYLYVTPVSLFVCASFRYKRFVTHTHILWCAGKVNKVQPTLVWDHLHCVVSWTTVRCSLCFLCLAYQYKLPSSSIAAQCSSCIFFVVWPLY